MSQLSMEKAVNYSDIDNIPHTIGTSGTSFDDDNVHTATNDGYLFIQAGTQSSTDQASAYIGSSYYVTVKTGTSQMIFIRKGTSYRRRTAYCQGAYVLEFTPLS